MGKAIHFQQLEVWQEAHRLVLMVYRVTKEYPGEERFGLVSQMRRAAVSIPANIAEGFKQRGLAEKIRFYNIAEGSLEELKYFLSCPEIWNTSILIKTLWLKLKPQAASSTASSPA